MPYILCQREDFDFSDLKSFQGLISPDDLPAGKKKRTHQFIYALLPHLVIRMRHAKLIELRKAEDTQPRRSTFERSSSSRTPNTQQTRPKPPEFFPFKSIFNYPALYVDPKVRERSMQLLKEKFGDWVRSKLHEIMVVVSELLSCCS